MAGGRGPNNCSEADYHVTEAVLQAVQALALRLRNLTEKLVEC
jgi:hypothetical protein